MNEGLTSPTGQDLVFSPPGRTLTNLTVEYIDNAVDERFCKVFTDPKKYVYNHQLDRFVLKDPAAISSSIEADEDIKDQRESFFTAMKKYERLAKPENKSNLKLQANHTWKEAIACAENAKRAYQAQAEGSNAWKAIRRCFRKFSKNAKAFESWPDVLPEGDYSSVLCGGFKMIFIAASKIDDVRGDIYNLIGSIPYVIAQSSDYSSIFQNAPERSKARLETKIAELYVAVLDGLEHVLGWLTEKAAGKVLKAFLTGDVYERKLTEKKDRVKYLAKEVRIEASISSQERQARMEQNYLEHRLETARGNLDIHRIYNTVGRIEEAQKNSYQPNSGFELQIANRLYELLQSSPGLKWLEESARDPRITRVGTK